MTYVVICMDPDERSVTIDTMRGTSKTSAAECSAIELRLLQQAAALLDRLAQSL